MNDKYKNKTINKKFYSKFKINNSPITDDLTLNRLSDK